MYTTQDIVQIINEKKKQGENLLTSTSLYHTIDTEKELIKLGYKIEKEYDIRGYLLISYIKW